MLVAQKRGLSDVVTTVLIILIVLAAVAIIWGYLRGALQQGGQQITTACDTLDLRPMSCNVSQATQLAGASVTYGRNSGVATLSNITIVWSYADGTTSSNYTAPINNLETKVFSTTLGAVASARPTGVAVAGTVTTEAGSTKLCDMSERVACQ